MTVLINFKICDNAKECNGIAVCKNGAISWDDNKKTIIIDNSKCINCGLCEDACMVGAIKFAKDNKEYEKLKKEIDEDPRKATDLFVDRYGATPIHPAFLIKENKFKEEVEESHKTTVAEIFNNESIMCLLNSMTIRELFDGYNIKYRKVELTTENIIKKYKIKKLPALLFFKDGKFIDKIVGYYDDNKKRDIQKKIKKILS